MSGRSRWLTLTLAALLLPVAALAQIAPEEYMFRRSHLRDTIGDGIYYFAGAAPARGEAGGFVQDPDFYYLTGYDRPGARLLMSVRGDESREILFIPMAGPSAAIWEGEGPGQSLVEAASGLEVRPPDQFDAVLRELMMIRPGALVSLPGPVSDETAAGILEQMQRSGRFGAQESGATGVRLVNPRRTLSDMRALKSAAEIDLLQTASHITREAHIEAMRATEPGMNEFEIQAIIEYSFRRYGSHRPGFDSIVGSGANSTILHYSDNERFMEPDDMLVMDIGASYGNYTTDITRTIPVDGKFSPAQRDIYELVLEAALAAQELAETEGIAYSRLSRRVQEIFGEGLTRLGLIESPTATLPGGRRSQVSLWFMHGLGHGIGLVVHDSMTPTIQPGDCFTIEPGIYIRPDGLNRLGSGPEADQLREKLRPAVERYANIGVRIEDSYAFTERGLVRLSEGVPRTIEEVEAAMAEPSVSRATRNSELVERFRRLIPPPPR
jgi:Xaa-Pro aminopeptidase